MKNHELIARVGGIDKAQEIVAGAPDGSVGFGGEDGDCDYFRGNEYFDSDYELWMEVYFEMPLINKIDDLRTAIANMESCQ